MNDSSFVKPDLETLDDTKAGNYFIANYPPFSFWSEKDLPCVESMLASPTPGLAPLGLYYHVPFCRKLATFATFGCTPIKIPPMSVATWRQPCRNYKSMPGLLIWRGESPSLYTLAEERLLIYPLSN